MPKLRLDSLLVERGLASSRSQAQALIMSGQVSADGRVLDKPGTAVLSSLAIHVKRQSLYVSRAGDKLASVAPALAVSFANRVVLDVGSSTGGFTDFALQQGASRAYCVDVGTSQLAQKLRLDARVVAIERTDIRDVRFRQASSTPSKAVATNESFVQAARRGKQIFLLPERADIAVIDVSFISLRLVLPTITTLVKPYSPIIAMVKPQFEAGKALADRYQGVIPLGTDRDIILADLRSWLMDQGFEIRGEADSQVAGARGNIERFMDLRYELER